MENVCVWNQQKDFFPPVVAGFIEEMVEGGWSVLSKGCTRPVPIFLFILCQFFIQTFPQDFMIWSYESDINSHVSKPSFKVSLELLHSLKNNRSHDYKIWREKWRFRILICKSHSSPSPSISLSQSLVHWSFFKV